MADDFDEILRLNSEWAHVTSSLERDSLVRLHEWSAYHRVCERGGRIIAFVLALGPGAGYDSPNYRWFDASTEDFIYIDRIIISREYQRTGLGDALYDDLFAFARHEGIARVVCEVDIEPLNEASDRFHTRRGFVELGTQWVAGGSKRVSLRECAIG